MSTVPEVGDEDVVGNTAWGIAAGGTGLSAWEWAKDWARRTLYDPIAGDLEKRAADAATEAAQQAGPDIESNVRAGLEPVQKATKTATYVMIGAGILMAGAAAVLVWKATKKTKRKRR